jgi:hypothetical protein
MTSVVDEEGEEKSITSPGLLAGKGTEGAEVCASWNNLLGGSVLHVRN